MSMLKQQVREATTRLIDLLSELDGEVGADHYAINCALIDLYHLQESLDDYRL